MLITDITEMSKTKVRLYIDYQAAFVLYKSELKKYGIKLGVDLPEQTYQMLVGELLTKRATHRAMKLLAGRDYTERKLVNKLKQDEYPLKAIDKAIAYVKSYGYIDDARYAKSYISCAGASKSRKQIISSLLNKGVARKTIEEALAFCIKEDAIADETELIKSWMAKKNYDSTSATSKEKQKIAGFLYRKGFSPDKIYAAVGQSD